jgi:hypothetical protein
MTRPGGAASKALVSSSGTRGSEAPGWRNTRAAIRVETPERPPLPLRPSGVPPKASQPARAR